MLGPSRTPVFRRQREPAGRRRAGRIRHAAGRVPPEYTPYPPPLTVFRAHHRLHRRTSTPSPSLQTEQSHRAPADGPPDQDGTANRRCALTSLRPRSVPPFERAGGGGTAIGWRGHGAGLPAPQRSPRLPAAAVGSASGAPTLKKIACFSLGCPRLRDLKEGDLDLLLSAEKAVLTLSSVCLLTRRGLWAHCGRLPGQRRVPHHRALCVERAAQGSRHSPKFKECLD